MYLRGGSIKTLGQVLFKKRAETLFGVILVQKLDVKFSRVFIRYKDTH